MTENLYPDLEVRLRPLAEPNAPTRPGDWLADHHEQGQTFRQYLAGNPVRRDSGLTTIYLCVIGECDAAQQSVIDLTREFLSVFFDSPVVVRSTVYDIPNTAIRQIGIRTFLARFAHTSECSAFSTLSMPMPVQRLGMVAMGGSIVVGIGRLRS